MKRVALVHDYLCTLGGSDRIFGYMCEAIPEADVYTLALNRSEVFPYFARRENIRTTWMNSVVRNPSSFRALFPVATHVMQRLDLSSYDLVISSAATVARYVRAPNGRHVSYCYIPTRAIWHFDEYFRGGLAARTFGAMLPYLKRRELEAVAHTDEFIAISEVTRGYIRKYYGRESSVIHCPIDTLAFAPRADRRDAYLIVSRLEHSKRLEHAIEAFTRLRIPLRIIGQGPRRSALRAMAGPNVTFLGAVDEPTLAEEYARARAVVFTPFLEYGLTPLEANASGTPVIAYGRGGVEETMIPANGPRAGSEPPTAVFYFEQTPESVVEAVRLFESMTFEPTSLVSHASKWNVPAFQDRLKRAVSL